MGTVNRSIQSDYDRDMAAKLVANRPYPFTLTITDGKHRSTAQNRLQHMWMKEISEQKGDITAAEARAYCKLTIGVPILREQNEAFRLRYDEILKPLSYEQKLAIMSEPLNLPVTSLMSTKQLTEYLEGIIRHFGQQGIVLTMPDDMREELNTNSDDTPSTASSSDNAGNTPVDEAGASEAGTSSAPASTIYQTDRADLIECCRKLMYIVVDQSLETPQQRRATLVTAKDNWKDSLPAELHLHIKAFVESADAQIKADPKVMSALREKALTHFAEVLDCKASDLGGVDG